MDKSTQIKAQLVGPNALILLIAIVANHYAKKYQIEVSSDTIMLAAAAVGAWWTNRHVNKTAVMLDTARLSDRPMTMPELNATAAVVQEVQSGFLPGTVTTQTIDVAKQVAQVRELAPQATLKDALIITGNATKENL